MENTKPTIEVTAATVEEAIERGAQQLGVPKESLLVEVIDEGTRGVLGMSARQAHVRLQAVLAPTRPAPASPPVLEFGGDDDEALSTTRVVLEELLERMEIRAQIDVEWGEPSDDRDDRPMLVNIHGGDLTALIGRKGETLSALQYITRLIVGKETQRMIPIVVDVDGFRARREEQLRRLARSMATQAVEQSRTMVLEPMPANERRIIHLELRDSTEVTTESTGEGDQRKVTVIPRP